MDHKPGEAGETKRAEPSNESDLGERMNVNSDGIREVWSPGGRLIAFIMQGIEMAVDAGLKVASARRSRQAKK